MRNADPISHVKRGKINADVLIAGVIGKFNFRKIYYISLFCTVTIFKFCMQDCTQISCIIQKIEKFYYAKNFCQPKPQHFHRLKIFDIREFFKPMLFVTYTEKKMIVTVLLFYVRSIIHHY